MRSAPAKVAAVNGPVATRTSGKAAASFAANGGAGRVSATRTLGAVGREMARERVPGEPEAQHDALRPAYSFISISAWRVRTGRAAW